MGFSWISTCGFSKKPSLRKLWREKANIQMSSYKSVRPVHRGRFSSLLRRVILMFPIVMAALYLPCTAAVASSAASDSRRTNINSHVQICSAIFWVWYYRHIAGQVICHDHELSLFSSAYKSASNKVMYAVCYH